MIILQTFDSVHDPSCSGKALIGSLQSANEQNSKIYLVRDTLCMSELLSVRGRITSLLRYGGDD